MPRGAARASCRPSSRRCTSAPRREDAASTSTALILDRGRLPPGRVADGALGRLAFFLSEARPIASSAAKDVDDARLWLRRAEISSQQMADASDVVVGRSMRCGAGHWRHRRPSPSSGGRALKRTPLHHRRAHASTSTELMRRLMSQAASSHEIHDELRALFQKLISLSQGL